MSMKSLETKLKRPITIIKEHIQINQHNSHTIRHSIVHKKQLENRQTITTSTAHHRANHSRLEHHNSNPPTYQIGNVHPNTKPSHSVAKRHKSKRLVVVQNIFRSTSNCFGIGLQLTHVSCLHSHLPLPSHFTPMSTKSSFQALNLERQKTLTPNLDVNALMSILSQHTLYIQLANVNMPLDKYSPTTITTY